MALWNYFWLNFLNIDDEKQADSELYKKACATFQTTKRLSDLKDIFLVVVSICQKAGVPDGHGLLNPSLYIESLIVIVIIKGLKK